MPNFELPTPEAIKKIPSAESLVEKAGLNPKAIEAARKAKLLDEKTNQLMSMLSGARKKPESAPKKPTDVSGDYWGGVDSNRPSSLQ